MLLRPLRANSSAKRVSLRRIITATAAAPEKSKLLCKTSQFEAVHKYAVAGPGGKANSSAKRVSLRRSRTRRASSPSSGKLLCKTSQFEAEPGRDRPERCFSANSSAKRVSLRRSRYWRTWATRVLQTPLQNESV